MSPGVKVKSAHAYVQNMFFADFLWQMLHGRTLEHERMVMIDERVTRSTHPDEGVFEILKNGSMDLVAEILHGTSALREHDRRGVVWKLTFGLGVDAHELQIQPELFE